MKLRTAAVVTAALLVTMLAGCGNEIQKNKDVNRVIQGGGIVSTDDEDVTSDSETTAAEEIPTLIEQDPEEKIPVYEEIKIKPSEAAYTEFSKEYNAESGSLSGSAITDDTRDGFKGTGYVTNIKKETDWEISFDLPETQYYNITLIAAADEAVRNGISVNGSKLSEFTLTGKGQFESCIFRNIMLEKGINKISIVPENGVIDIDCVEISSSEDISKLSFDIKSASLSNKNAGYNAKALYKYIADGFGSQVILGQYDTIGTNYESELIYETTGKHPAVRFGDFMYVTSGGERANTAAAELNEAVEWHSQGGIVGYMWNWTSPAHPDDTESIYAENADFDISNAVTDEKISRLDIEDIRAMQSAGDISEECLMLVEDIDKVSEQLAVLRDEGAAVLWRPLQEASNGYFWWGADSDSYKWLWSLMYERMTQYHKLDNLIWVWSAQNADWYVGDSKCDILSVDIYTESGSKDGRVNSLLYLQGISAAKPIAMSECGSMPIIQNLADEKAMWAYIGQWGGNYIVDKDGNFSEEYNSASDVITMYNNNLTVTREELPDFISLAEELKNSAEDSSSEAP